MTSGATVTIAEIPTGAGNLEIELIAGADLDIKLVDPDDEDNCIAGYSCTYAGSPPTGASGDYQGMAIAFTGDMTSAGDDGFVREQVTITGRTTKPLILQVKAYDDTSGDIRYQYDDIVPCALGSGGGCASCGDFADCENGQIPHCDGTETVSCVDAWMSRRALVLAVTVRTLQVST